MYRYVVFWTNVDVFKFKIKIPISEYIFLTFYHIEYAVCQ
jgi:hypothetical protein